MLEAVTVSSRLDAPTIGRTSVSPRVLKFGGSSLASADRIRAVGTIILRSRVEHRTIVVVSAFQQVTDALLDCARAAARRLPVAEQLQQALVDKHRAVVADVIGESDGRTISALGRLESEFAAVIHDIQTRGNCSPEDSDLVASFGERWSALIVAGHVNRTHPSRFVDARDLLVTDDRFTRAAVDVDRTRRNIRAFFAALWRRRPAVLPIVTGFIARSADGRTTTIGRNGSDYSAAIIGAALRASAVEIWKDVDGVLSADPQILGDTAVLSHMTYDAARELSEAGAKVLHAAAIGPIAAEAIPLVVKNTLNPDAPGTVISRQLTGAPHGGSVTSVRDVTLFTVRNVQSCGDRAMSDRVSRALATAGIQPVLAWQAWSSLAATIGVRAIDAAATAAALRVEFANDLAREATRLSEQPDHAVIGLIGSGLDHASPMLRALAAENVGVRAILPGASAGSLSCVVDAASCARATRIAHRWCVGDRSVFGIALLGVGKVGSAVLSELHDHRAAWRQRGVDVRLVAIADSRRMLIAPDGIDLAGWRASLETQGRRTELRELASAVGHLALPAAAVLDCTADDRVVDAYDDFVGANLHVVTPNKRASVLPWRRFSSLHAEFVRRRRRWLDSATVGAGLPILSTLRDLVAGGDTITKIEGVLSGTLGFLFNCLDRGTPFSVAVEDARRQGLTEPDPREDLSGIDVARKILILARQAALPLELADVDTETLVGCDDETMRRRTKDARARGAVLRYVATLEQGRASAGVREVPVDHPLARTKGCDNTVAISSVRYAATPLVICGPGAGATITAKAVIADLGKLLHEARG